MVADPGDHADVVPVGRLDLLAQAEVGGGVEGAGEPVSHGLGVDAHCVGGAAFDLAGVSGPCFEFWNRDRAGEVVDPVGVGVLGEREELGQRAFELAVELGVDVARLFGGEWDPVVVASQFGVDGLHLGGGEDQPVGAGASGELDVGGFPVEAIGADGDGGVPGAALGPVGCEGVAVVDVAGV